MVDDFEFYLSCCTSYPLLTVSYRFLQESYQFIIMCYEDGDHKFDQVFASPKVDTAINSWLINTYLILKPSGMVCATSNASDVNITTNFP